VHGFDVLELAVLVPVEEVTQNRDHRGGADTAADEDDVGIIVDVDLEVTIRAVDLRASTEQEARRKRLIEQQQGRRLRGRKRKKRTAVHLDAGLSGLDLVNVLRERVRPRAGALQRGEG
jgi:hypothetical protein